MTPTRRVVRKTMAEREEHAPGLRLGYFQGWSDATAERQYGEARVVVDADDELGRWLVPEDQRPTCPVSGQPCTSWTCLVDACSPPHSDLSKGDSDAL